MTGRTTKTEVLEMKEQLEQAYSGSFWFKGITMDADDGGLHLEFRVTDMKEAVADGLDVNVPKIKVCFIPVGKDMQKVASA